jgi:hypothetical protein
MRITRTTFRLLDHSNNNISRKQADLPVNALVVMVCVILLIRYLNGDQVVM